MMRERGKKGKGRSSGDKVLRRSNRSSTAAVAVTSAREISHYYTTREIVHGPLFLSRFLFTWCREWHTIIIIR